MIRQLFSFSLWKSLLGVAVFCVLFFVTMWAGNQSLFGQTGLSTGKPGEEQLETPWVSGYSGLVQSLYFHKPVCLHKMRLYPAKQQSPVNIDKIRIELLDQSHTVKYWKSLHISEVYGRKSIQIDLKGVSLASNEQYYLIIKSYGEHMVTAGGLRFALMEEKEPFAELYTEHNEEKLGRSLRMQIEYDVLPMAPMHYVGYLLLLFLILAVCNLKRRVLGCLGSNLLPVLWSFFFIGVFLAVCLDNDVENLENLHQGAAVFVCLFAITILYCVLKRYRKYGPAGFYHLNGVVHWIKRHEKVVCGAYFILLFAAQCFIAFWIFRKVAWDANATWDAATWWQTHEDPILGEYLLLYPNNITLTMLLYFIRMPIQELGMSSQYWIVVMFNIISIDLGIYLCARLSKRFLGRKGAVLSLALLTMLFGFSGYMAVPYTDTLTFFLPVLLLSLYLKIRECRRVPGICVLSLLMGILLIWGYKLKPQCVIVMIAIALIEGGCLLRRCRDKRMDKKYAARGAILCLCLVFGAAGGEYARKSLQDRIVGGYISELAIPMEHFLMMGLNENCKTSLVGTYSAMDVKYTKSFAGKERKKKACRERIVKRIRKYGLMGLGRHMYRKTVGILGDGAFFWHRENAGYSFWYYDYMSDDSSFRHLIREIYDGKYNNYSHGKFLIMGAFVTGIWFFMLLLMAVPVKRRTPQTKGLSMAVLAAFGCLLFTMLFEARSRYLINYLPLFTIAASAGMLRIFGWVKRKYRCSVKG